MVHLLPVNYFPSYIILVKLNTLGTKAQRTKLQFPRSPVGVSLFTQILHTRGPAVLISSRLFLIKRHKKIKAHMLIVLVWLNSRNREQQDILGDFRELMK